MASRSRSAAARGIARFLTLFGVFILAGHFLLASGPGGRLVLDPWTGGNVRAAVALSKLLDLEARADGRLLQADGAALEINQGCDGTTSVLILFAAILAFPATWRAKLVGLSIGAAIVFLVNALRLATLLLVAVRWPARLDLFHVDIWQPLMMVVSFALFLLWGTLLATGSRGRARPGPGPAES